ncbi:MAG: type I-C CRISPR-associated protein Cas8c/Csd1 [Anaerolineae bacterium]
MFLRRLVELSERPGYESPPRGYAPKPIRYIIELDEAGRPLTPHLTDTADAKDRNLQRGHERLSPTLRRGSTPRALLLADNGTYVLGLAAEGRTEDSSYVRERHAAFRELIDECARATDDPDVRAVAAFYASGAAASLNLTDVVVSENFTFSVASRLPIDSPVVKRFWAERQETRDNVMQCVVCGKHKPVLRTLETMIKRVPGGNTSGTSIISFNAKAFESYGLEQSFNAPICTDCAERSHYVLNKLLSDERTRLTVGESALVAWTRDEAPFPFLDMLQQPDPDLVRELMRSPFTARHASVDPNRFYAALLGASGGRTQVRSWLDTTVDEAMQNLARWFSQQRIVGPWGEDPKPLSVRSLAAATVRDMKEVTSRTVSSLYLAALTGYPVPPSVIPLVVARTRADQTVQQNHAAALKLALCATDSRMEENMVELDLSNHSPAYLCGRLLAELEQAQRSANPSAKATIIDRYYGTAATAPASVFGTLIQGAQAHLGKLERDRPGAYNAIQARMEEILAALDTFPATLNLNEQALFALGYYHQRAANRAAATANREEKSA